MRFIRTLIVPLFLLSLGFSNLIIIGNLSSYNPGEIMRLNISSYNASDGQPIYVNVGNSSHIVNCTCNGSAFDASNNSYPNCTIPNNLMAGSWTINISKFNNGDTNSTSFTLNYTVMRMNVSSPGNFSPGTNFAVYVNMSYHYSSEPFYINTSNFYFIVSNTSAINCSSLTMTVAGNYTATCTVNSSAIAGVYALNGSYPNAKANETFAVNVSYLNPWVASLNTSLTMDIERQQNISINVTSRSNLFDIINISHNCDGISLICSLNSTEIVLPPFGNTYINLTINSTRDADNGTQTVSVEVKSLNDTSKSNQSNISVFVNPLHNFSLAGSGSAVALVAGGQTVQYNFTITNTGNVTVYNFSCNNTSVNFTCIFNCSNNTQIDAGANLIVGINVTVLNSAPLGEQSKTDAYATDSYGLKKLVGGTFFTTTADASTGNVTVTNVSQYVHYPSETYSFNISINNTANVDGDTLYNITIYAQNTSGWILNVTNDSNLLNFTTMNDSYILNLTLNISALSHKNISVGVVVPAGATAANFTKLFIMAKSAASASRFSENATVVIKLPNYIVSVNMQFNNAFGAERLNWTIVNITREPSVGLNLSMLNCSILSPNGTVQTFFNATYGTTYSNASNATAQFNVSNWPTGAYNLTLVGGGSDNYNFTWNGTFYIARWVGLTGSVLSYTMATGINFNVTVSNVFGATSISVNASSASSPITYVNFGSGGGSCSSIPYVNTSYIFSCTTSTATNTSYYLNITSLVSSCSRDFNCTFAPTLSNKTAVNISETYSPGTTGDGQQGAPPSGNATNRTTTTTTGLKFTMPSNVTLLNTSQTIYIPLNNTNTSRQNVSVNISEASDYIHFSLTYIAPKNISGNSTSTVNITLTPFKWAKPGSYTVTATINSANSTFTVTVPQPNDTKKIHRYVEVSKNRTTSMVTLSVKNRNSYSVFMNVTENISKQIAASASNLTITSAINYTIIEQDPVIMWMMNMSPNQERSIIYLAGGDLGNSNLFKEPNVTEGRMSTGGGGGGVGGGGDMTWLIIVIVVVVVIAAAVVVYLFFLKPRGIKLPIKYGAFVKQEKKGEGVLGVLKGITAKIMSVFKRGEKKEAPVGEKKSLLSRLSFKKKAEVKEEPKKEEKKIEPGKPKPTKEELIKKLSEVYKK